MPASFAQAQFGKPIDQITADDLVNYFSDEQEESLTLEFKSYYAKEKVNFDGVLRTITAFLNSEGGLLIFGAPIDIVTREKYRVAKGDPTPIPTNITTKDSLINRISDNISYMPVGIRIEAVPMRNGDFVYLIEVQESTNKPHQYNKQYPIRLDGQTTGAPHYLVEALFKQVRIPELEGYLRVTSYTYQIPSPNPEARKIFLTFEVSIFNKSKTINDTGLYVNIEASAGQFMPNDETNYLYSGRKVFVQDTSSLITYALSPSYKFNYEIWIDEFVRFIDSDASLEISIWFGSHSSITRRSDYYLQFKNIPVQDIKNIVLTDTRQLNAAMDIRKDENLSMNDYWQDSEDLRRELSLSGI